MLGAHLDSWHGGTGATDNAAGSAVVMEAVRILKSLNLKMDRTVRMALWGGEEEGLLGSKAYVKEHFADRETMKLAAEHAKLAGYFNYDNGTGKIRGIYLQGNDMVRPIFESWLEPFKDLGATTVTIRNTGGTDHQSFDAVGLPGFQFIQDPMDYSTRTHHSNMDVYDHVQAGDLMQASAIMASFVYNTAMRPEMLPRKPLPKPQPEKKAGWADGVNFWPRMNANKRESDLRSFAFIRGQMQLCHNEPHAFYCHFTCLLSSRCRRPTLSISLSSIESRPKLSRIPRSWNTLHLLTDRYGPRLTGSPEFKEAADWAAKRLAGVWAGERASGKVGAVRA